MIGSNTYD
jgi:hypothetical protein